jgi:hypothetical protein
MVFDGISNRKLGTCPIESPPFFCCVCQAMGEYEYSCMPCTPEWVHNCQSEMGCVAWTEAPMKPCPVSSCNQEGDECNPWGVGVRRAMTIPTQAPAVQPANPGRLGMRVTFEGLRPGLTDSAAELLADPNRTLRCAMLSSWPEQAVFVGADLDPDGVAGVEVRIYRNSPPTNWIMYAYALVRAGGERYRLMYFLGGGSSWRRIMEGETVRLPNVATTSGNQAGILADPSGWAEISLDRTA